MKDWTIEDMIREHFSSLDTSYINKLRALVTEYTDKELEVISDRLAQQENITYTNKEDELMMYSFIEDEGVFISQVQKLADELFVVALYRLIEMKHEKLLETVKKKPSSNYSYWKKVTKEHEEIENLDHYPIVNELRLLNNSIKHGGVVSKWLAEITDVYGKENEELQDIGENYERLLEGAKEYVKELYGYVSAQDEFREAYKLD